MLTYAYTCLHTYIQIYTNIYIYISLTQYMVSLSGKETNEKLPYIHMTCHTSYFLTFLPSRLPI